MRTIAAMMMVAGVGLATPSLNRRAHAASCVGDCNADGEVTVDEVLTMVNIALGTLPASSCTAGDASGDGAITIDEILAAVNNALGTCPEPPTPTATTEASPTFTPTNSPTATPTPSSVATATDTPTATAEPTLTPLLPQVVIGNASGAPGTSVDVPISLSTRGLHLVIVAPLEFRVDADILSLESCTSAVAGKPAVADMLEGGRVRLVLAGDLTLIADGLIVTCRLHIASTAATGSTPLSFQTAELADSDFHDIAATGLDGSVTVTP